jgi:hypothetical protein
MVEPEFNQTIKGVASDPTAADRAAVSLTSRSRVPNTALNAGLVFADSYLDKDVQTDLTDGHAEHTLLCGYLKAFILKVVSFEFTRSVWPLIGRGVLGRRSGHPQAVFVIVAGGEGSVCISHKHTPPRCLL